MEAIDNKNLIVSGAHSLRVLDASKVFSMGVLQGGVYMLSFDLGIELDAVPGTVVPSDTAEDGLFHKLIAFRLGQVSQSRTELLQALSAIQIIAIYVDEHGKNRVAGSLDWPMVLTYSIAGGLYECQLECRGLEPNPYLKE